MVIAALRMIARVQRLVEANKVTAFEMSRTPKMADTRGRIEKSGDW